MAEHAIVSLSVERKELERIEKARSAHGFPERSAFWRKAMAEFLDQIEGEALSGTVRGALIVVHEEAKEDVLHRLKHGAIVTTHLHNHFRETGECLEVLVLEGDGKKVEVMLAALRKEKSVRFVRFVRA